MLSILVVHYGFVYAQESPVATPDQGLGIGAAYMLSNDDNLFRLPESSGNRVSERIARTSADLRFAKSYSLQSVFLNAEFAHHRYDRLGYLGFDALNYLGLWQWSLTPRIKGSVSTERKQELNNFADYRAYTTRNVRTARDTRADVEGRLGDSLSLIGAIDERREANELPGVIDGDRALRARMAGLRYAFATGSTIGYEFSRSTGESNLGYLPAIAGTGAFTQDQHAFTTLWAFTGKTTLQGKVGYVDRRYESSLAGGFSGPIADLTVRWKATGKTDVEASLRRELVSYLSTVSTHLESNRLSVTPTWRATPQVRLGLRLDYAFNDFAGVPVSSADSRQDHYRSAAFTIGWQPVESMLVSLSLQRMVNRSSLPVFSFTSNAVSVMASLRFQ